MGDSDYSFSLTTFSPSGRLVQIEYALQAVTAGATALGIKGKFPFLSTKTRHHGVSKASTEICIHSTSACLENHQLTICPFFLPTVDP